MERKIINIVGPTCSGKTKIAIEIAEKLGTEIISTDSRQVYKYLDIGTAKPSSEELRKIKHHFIDYLEPEQDYNVSRFETEALEIIKNLTSKNKIPIAAGGSGLYIKALTDGIFNNVDTDEEYRDLLKQKIEKYGREYLYEELKKVDPESAAKMLPQNWKRVMRALEVFHISGSPIWKFQQTHKREDEYKFYHYGLSWERSVLYKNIEDRVDRMIQLGLIEETKSLLSMGYSKNLNSLNTVGYKEIIAYLENEISLERAIELIKRNTRRFAKRQMTWFRKDERIKWFEISSEREIENIPRLILEDVQRT